MIVNLLFIYGLIVLFVGFKKDSQDLKTVGWIGMGLAIFQVVAVLILFGLSDM
ncbi:MAG: hypothetical protein P8J32_00635 [bacterium]|jgi:hypothetical protein|nr:hypothetical protein [bacterium]